MKISVLEPLGIPNDKLVSLIKAASPCEVEVMTHDDRCEDEQTLVYRSDGADIVVLSNIPYPRAVMEQCPSLRYICVAFTGYDHVDMAYCRERGIQVSNCAGYSTAAVADLVFGMVIGLLRSIVTCDATVRAGGTKAGLIGPELEGLRFGVIGAGAIGSRVARIANAFGCEVYAYSRTPKDLPGVTFTDLDTLLATCDVVSLHVPQTPQTCGLIGTRELSLMKPSAILINAARGPVVDAEALAAALREGRLAGAGIDVFDREPPLPADHPLLQAPRVIATPHIGFASIQAFEKRAAIVADNIGAWLREDPVNLV